MALELKRSKFAVATELQKYNIEKINEAGGYAVLLYPENLELVMEEIEKL